METVARDCHRRQLLPRVRLRIISLIGAEHLPGSLAAEYDDFAVDIDARWTAAWRGKRCAEGPGIGLWVVNRIEAGIEIIRVHTASDGMDFSINNGNAHVVTLADKWLRTSRTAHACKDRIFVGRGIINLVPLDRADIAPAEQMDLAIEHDRRHCSARPREAGDRRPLVGRCIVDEALRMRAAILFDESAERVNL